MASYDASINLIVSGTTKIDKIINKAAQLESIVNDINKKPLEVNIAKVTSAFDTLESNLKASRSTLLSQQKAADQAAGSIDSYTDQIVDLQRKLAGLNPNTKKYNDLLDRQNQAIRGRAAAEKEANASLERVAKTQAKIAGLEKDTARAKVAKESAIAVENLADSYLRLGTAQQKSINESSIASLGAQAEALKLVANNSQVASSQFNRFAIATQAASQKIFEARQKQLGALAFGLSPEAPRVNVGRGGAGSIAGARNLVGSLIASGSEVVKSEAALSDYAERLRSLQSLVPYTSNEFRALEEALAGVNNELDEARRLASGIGLRGQKSAIQPISGPATDLGSVKAFQQKESFQRRINDELAKQAGVEDRISRANVSEVQALELRNRLEQAVGALAENRLEDAQRITREIDKQRMSMERANRAARGGQQSGGGVYRTGEFSPTGGRRRLSSTLASGAIIEQGLINLQSKGADVANELLALQNALNDAKREDFDISLKNLDALSDQVALAGKYAQLQRTILAGQSAPRGAGGFPSSPVRGGVGFPGSPIFRETPFLERRFGRRGGAAISEGLIGGAFPLLFGQGLGAAIGGGAGGAAGGFAGGGLGFGLSLVGTALGTAFDTLSQAAQDTGKALNYPIDSFEKLKEAGLFASRQQEYYISKLIESGRTVEAAAKIQSRIVEVVGVQGANDLMELGDSASLLGKRWSELNYQMQALVAGPVGDFLELLAKVAGAKIESNKMVGLGERISQLTPEQRKAFQQEAKKFTGPDYTKGAEEILNRIAPQQLNQSKRDLAQEEISLNKSIETAEKIRSLRQQGVDVERSAQDLRLGVEDTVYGLRRRSADMEREAVEFRRSIEDQIFSKRQELEQKLIENDRKRQQNAIEAFDLQLQKASTGLDPVAQSVIEAARQYLRIRAEGEADLQQNEKQLKLQLQQIDQETSRYKLQIEDRVSQMTIQREEFARDVSKVKLQIERQIGDYAIKVEDYRLAMAKHRYDLEIDLERKKQITAREGLGTPYTGRNYANVGGFTGGRQMLHGIPGFAGYDPSHASETNIHYHFAGKNPAETKAVAEYMKGLGYQITEFGGFGQRVGQHAQGSQHYANNAFDIPGASMEGRGGMADIIAGQKLAHARILDFLNARGRQTAAVQAGQRVTGGAPIAPTAPAMPSLPSAPQMIGVNDLMTQYLNLQIQTKAALQANNQEEVRRLQLQTESARLAYEQQTLAPLRQYQEQNRELQFEIEKRQIRNRLLAEGVKPEIVEGELRVLEISRTLNSVLQGLDVSTNELVRAELGRLNLNSALVGSTFSLTEATIASLVATTEDVKKQEELRNKLQEILDLRDRLAGKAEDEASKAAKGARGVAAEEARPGQKLQEFIAQATAELNDLEAVAVRASQGIGDAVANSLANGISGLVEGTTTAKQVFADFLKEVGQILVREGTKMIATYIAIGIAKIFAGFIGGGGGGGKPALLGSMGSATKTGLDTGAGNISDALGSFAANGAYFANGIAAFANGGMFTNSVVSSPTLFKFADGGAMRTGVMGEAGPEAIMPLSRGSDGRLGVDANGLREAMSASGGSSSTPMLNMTFETTSINGVEYVSREQLETAMAATRRQAAKDGAKQGMNMTLDRLQQSPKTRSRVGLR